MQNSSIHITECPRDAMQGIKAFIPTDVKVQYLNQLLSCGFHRLDFGSFVSPKAVPQMQDTSEVLMHLDSKSKTNLLAIVANERGAEQALVHQRIQFLGFPFSISETFQHRNTGASTLEAKTRLSNICKLSESEGRNVMLYLSMGFGNPYGDSWSPRLVVDHAKELFETMGIRHFALSDTIGCAVPEVLSNLYTLIRSELNEVEVGIHLHVLSQNTNALLTAAYDAGCRHIDSAMLGIGGCPMAKDDLTGNLSTENLIDWAGSHGYETHLQTENIQKALQTAQQLFSKYH